MIIYWLIRRWRQRRPAARAGQPQPQPTQGNDNAAAMVLHQARYELLGFLRNRQARFFTVLLPLLFLVIFVSIFGKDNAGGGVKASTYYVPGLAAMAIIAASFVNLVISITTERETGVLKRRRATPVPAWVLIAGRTLMAMGVSLGVMAVVLTVGALAYGVQVPWSGVPAILVTAVLGSATFCVLGYALASVIGSADAAQPMTQAVMLPLYFISGVFVPNINLPGWLQNVARVFPVQHLADGLHSAFNPAQGGFVGSDIAVLLVWGVVGLAVAVRRFSWLPRVATA